MESQTSLLAARGLTDERDRLLTADDPLADLQKRCGGTLPGTLPSQAGSTAGWLP